MSARRERILESARQIIEEEGVAALTMRRLADDAGLTPPTLYNLLGSRTEILRALFWTALDALDARLTELPPEATGLDRAERIVTASVDIFTAAPATFRPAIAALLADHLENGSSIRAQETWRRCRDLQIAACRQAREEGDLVGAIESEWLGEEILTCYSAALRGWVQGDLSAAQFRARALHGLFVCALSDASNARRKTLHARAAEARRAFADAAASDAAACSIGGLLMQHERQLEIIDALMDLVDRGETARTDRLRFNDLSVYTDPDLLAREREVFFRQWPLVAALSADLPRPGAYIAQTMLETPVLIARGRDGVARAFVNACRHRGARIVEPGCGARNLFSCPFHAWSYTPEGRLAAAPHADSFGDLDSAQFGLTPLPLVERYGIIWVRLQPRGDAFDIDDYLGGLGPELEGWRLADGPRVGETEIECGINWKFAIDTFGETYHFETLHRDSVNNIFHSNRQLYDIYGRNHRMVFVARTIDELRNRPRADWRVRPHSLFAYYLFPNTQLLIQRSGASLFRIFPDAERPDRSVTRHAFYTEPFATDADSLAAAYATFEGTQRIIATEDYVMAEQAQAGLASGALRQAVFGRNEPALHHYHNTYRAALGLPPLAEAM